MGSQPSRMLDAIPLVSAAGDAVAAPSGANTHIAAVAGAFAVVCDTPMARIARERCPPPPCPTTLSLLRLGLRIRPKYQRGSKTSDERYSSPSAGMRSLSRLSRQDRSSPIHSTRRRCHLNIPPISARQKMSFIASLVGVGSSVPRGQCLRYMGTELVPHKIDQRLDICWERNIPRIQHP